MRKSDLPRDYFIDFLANTREKEFKI